MKNVIQIAKLTTFCALISFVMVEQVNAMQTPEDEIANKHVTSQSANKKSGKEPFNIIISHTDQDKESEKIRQLRADLEKTDTNYKRVGAQALVTVATVTATVMNGADSSDIVLVPLTAYLGAQTYKLYQETQGIVARALEDPVKKAPTKEKNS